jgi:hypothetical protein
MNRPVFREYDFFDGIARTPASNNSANTLESSRISHGKNGNEHVFLLCAEKNATQFLPIADFRIPADDAVRMRINQKLYARPNRNSGQEASRHDLLSADPICRRHVRAATTADEAGKEHQ